MLEDGEGNREAHKLLQYIASTLLCHCGALKYTSTAKVIPLRYDDIVVVSALAFPLTWTDLPVRRFLESDPVLCRKAMMFAADNHVRVQSFIKAGESRSKPSRRGVGGGEAQPPLDPVMAAVESLYLVARFLCGRCSSFDAILVDLDEGGAEVSGITALRLELHRALSNFLLRHMFFRMAPDASALRKLPKPLFVHIDVLPAWPVPSSFQPGALPSLPHELLHDVKSSEDPIVHALVNVFGFSVRGSSEVKSTLPPSSARRGEASRCRSDSPQSALTSEATRGFAKLTEAVSLSNLPVEVSTFYPRGDRSPSGSEYPKGDEDEDDEDDERGDLDGGLPWLQLMEDLKFLAGINHDLDVVAKRPIPAALNFSTLGPAEAISVQLGEGMMLLPSLIDKSCCCISNPVMRSRSHFGSSLLSVGLSTIICRGMGTSRSFPTLAEYVGTEFHTQKRSQPSSPRLQDAYLSQQLRDEQDVAFGVVRTLTHSIRVTAENISGLRGASAAEFSLGVSRDSEEQLELRHLLVRLGHRAFLGLNDPMSATFSHDDHQNAHRAFFEVDVLHALEECSSELVQCSDGLFLRHVFHSLKAIVDNVAPRGGRGSSDTERALAALRLLVACGARRAASQRQEDRLRPIADDAGPRVLLLSDIPNNGLHKDYDDVSDMSDGTFSPERSETRGENASTSLPGTEGINLVINCDRLVAALMQQLQWLKRRRVDDTSSVQHALNEITTLFSSSSSSSIPFLG